MENNNSSINNSMPPTTTEKPKVDVRVRLKEFFATLPPQQRKLLTIALAVFVILFVLLLVTALIKGTRRQNIVIPTPTPQATSDPLPVNTEFGKPSVYATDSGVLKLEEDIKAESRRLDMMDLEESNLRIPNFDFNIKFED